MQAHHDILQRLVRLEAIAKLLTEEVQAARTLFYSLTGTQESDEVNQPIPQSAKSKGVISDTALQAMEAQALALQASLPPPPSNVPEAPVASGDDKPVRDCFWGARPLLQRFLASTAINAGRGTIAPTRGLMQFEEDAMAVSVERLSQWPSGFYRDRTTREEQFVFHGTIDAASAFVFVQAGLPGTLGTVRLAHKENETWVEYSLTPKDTMIAPQACEIFELIQPVLEQELRTLAIATD